MKYKLYFCNHLSCFLNGKGNDSAVIVLTRAQQTRGINWTIERISKAFRVNGKKCVVEVLVK